MAKAATTTRRKATRKDDSDLDAIGQDLAKVLDDGSEKRFGVAFKWLEKIVKVITGLRTGQAKLRADVSTLTQATTGIKKTLDDHLARPTTDPASSLRLVLGSAKKALTAHDKEAAAKADAALTAIFSNGKK